MQEWKELNCVNYDVTDCVSLEGTELHFQVEVLKERLELLDMPVIVEGCMALEDDTPAIYIVEDGCTRQEYLLESKEGESLKGKYFLFTMVLQMDVMPLSPCMVLQGWISDDPESCDARKDIEYRLETYYFTNGEASEEHRRKIAGESLQYKNLDHPGFMMLSERRLVGICAECHKSFTFQPILNAKNETALYSTDGHSVVQIALDEPAKQIQEAGGYVELDGKRYAFQNAFRCPHCGAPYLDYENKPHLRDSNDPACVLLTKK